MCELLKEARSVTEILEIERQIGELRADIESIEERLKYLQNQVAYSTLTITVYQSIPGDREFARLFRQAFGKGLDNFIMFFILLTKIWPFILLGIVLFAAVKVYRRR